MALTDSSRIFSTQVQDIAGIMDYCKQYFEAREYDVTVENTLEGGFLSLTKGGLFRSISGMQTGLNITFTQMPGAITVSMKVGLFGKQLVPTAIAMLVFWPVLIPQIYGLVQQSKLDEEAYNVIETAIRHQENAVEAIPENTAFCVHCGKPMPADADFCTSCGKRVTEDETTCPNCGAELPDDFAFCPKCGTRIS